MVAYWTLVHVYTWPVIILSLAILLIIVSSIVTTYNLPTTAANNAAYNRGVDEAIAANTINGTLSTTFNIPKLQPPSDAGYTEEQKASYTQGVDDAYLAKGEPEGYPLVPNTPPPKNYEIPIYAGGGVIGLLALATIVTLFVVFFRLKNLWEKATPERPSIESVLKKYKPSVSAPAKTGSRAVLDFDELL